MTKMSISSNKLASLLKCSERNIYYYREMKQEPNILFATEIAKMLLCKPEWIQWIPQQKEYDIPDSEDYNLPLKEIFAMKKCAPYSTVSYRWLSVYTGIPLSSLTNYICGKTIPSVTIALAICEALKVNPKDVCWEV